jgi:hypothetical protein
MPAFSMCPVFLNPLTLNTRKARAVSLGKGTGP